MSDDWEFEDVKLWDWMFFFLLATVWILVLVGGLFFMASVLFL